MKAVFSIEDGLSEVVLVPLTEEEEAQRLVDAEASETKQSKLQIPFVLDTIFKTLPDTAQADLSTLKSAIKLDLEQGRYGIAKLIIERTTVPAELEEVRTQMLEAF